MKNLLKFLSVISLFSITVTSYAIGIFVPAEKRVDMIHDFERNLVYISNGENILRYDILTNTFLSPYNLGGSLSGIDISPDGNTLAVADRTRTERQVWVHLIDLNTGSSRKVFFPRDYNEGGTYTVSYVNVSHNSDGLLLLTSTSEGTSFVPLRKYEPDTFIHRKIRSVSQNTMLSASADLNTILYAESNLSLGPFGRYNLTNQSIEIGPGTYWLNYEIGSNSDGTHYSVPTDGGTYIYNHYWNLEAVIGTYAGPQPIGVVYHPVENRVYYPWANTREVREFDTSTNTQVAAYDFEHTFTNPGNLAFNQGRMKISKDGSLLMSTVTGGVRIVQMYEMLKAENQSVVLDEDTSAGITLNGSIGNNGALKYNITSTPSMGKLTGTAPNLTYTPNENANGVESFSYTVSYGRASVSATVSIVVNPINDAPVAIDDFYYTTGENITVPALVNDHDIDGDDLTIIYVTNPINNGKATINKDGQSIEYRYRGQKTLTDSFEYTISDGNGTISTATVRLNRWSCVNNPICY